MNKKQITKEMFDFTNADFDCDLYYEEFNKFNWEQYVENYLDLRQAGINNQEKAWEHWITNGLFEKRTCEKIFNQEYDYFDWEQYLENYPELKNEGIDNKEKAWIHWFNHGLYEDRTFKNINIEKLKNK